MQDFERIEKFIEEIKNDLVSGKTTFQAQIARRSEFRAKAAETTGRDRSNWLGRAEIIDAAMDEARCELIAIGKIRLGEEVA